MAGGLQATLANFPKFTTGWIVWSPAAGDLDSDGTVDLVANTREGYTMIWKTPGLATANTEWWRYRHDERNTARYGTDTRPPGILRSPQLNVALRSITFVAPGDDWYAGRPAKYRIVHDAGVLELPATVNAGQNEALTIPAGIDQGTVQAVDNAGNLGRAIPFDLVSGTIGSGQRLIGKRLSLRDGSDPAKRQLGWLAKDTTITLPQGADRPTVAGALLTITNPTTGETATLSMPASGWTESSKGFAYSDPRHALGPVKRAFLRARRLAKVLASGSGIGFTLDEPSQGSLGVVLTTGSRSYCTLFGGTVRTDRFDRFIAVRAPAPAMCPGA
jgi:hypothetical protein